MSQLSVPHCSPLATGWRRDLADLLTEVGLAEVLEAISAFAEFRGRGDSFPRRDLSEEQTERECTAPLRRRLTRKAVERGHSKL